MEITRDEINKLPSSPGVYIFKGRDGKIIYVGKAARLRDRVRSYFTGAISHPKVANLVREVDRIEYIETPTEKDAFLLENELIRKYQPKFNIRLKDDKSYPYLEITYSQPFPGIYIARRQRRKGSLYFGPFVPASWARKLKKIVSLFFGIRQCREKIDGKRGRPCLEYYIKRCSAPCVGYISQEEYRKDVERAIRFLKGDVSELARDIEKKMWEAAQQQEYERAAYYRDILFALREFERKPTFSWVRASTDFVGFAEAEGRWALHVWRIREGVLTDRRDYTGEGWDADPSSLLLQLYERIPDVPDRIVVTFPLRFEEKVKEFFEKIHGKAVSIEAPVGEENEIARRVQEAAENLLAEKKVEEQLQRVLGLKVVPFRIEGIDISHMAGGEVVGSVVVFEGGRPIKSEYRRYKLPERNDDYENIALLVERRYTKAEQLPDLVLIDGGRGQLHSAWRKLQEHGLADAVEVAAIAKREELIYRPDREEPIRLDATSPALKLLQRVRDEAHRFAVTYHRKLRSKRSLSSLLDEIEGIGPKRKRELLRRWGNLEEIMKAPEEELASVLGRSVAAKLKERLEEVLDESGD